MGSDPVQLKERVRLEPASLTVAIGARVAFLFDQDSDRTRFAPFIAAGIRKNEQTIIATDSSGRLAFEKALGELGIDVELSLADGLLLFITEQVDADQVEELGRRLQDEIRPGGKSIRFINDPSWMTCFGCTQRDFLRLEVKGHLFAQSQPCTFICQYDLRAVKREKLAQIIAAHQFTIKGDKVVRNADRRPLTQIIFEGMDEQLRALTQLQDVSLSLSSSLNQDEILDAVIDASMRICGTDRAAISYFEESGELRLIKHRGLSYEYLKTRRVTREDPSVAEMFRTKRPLIIEDVDEIGPASPNYQMWQREGVRSIVTLPLVSKGEVFGVIGAASGKVRRYTQTEVDAMAILAAQAGAAITNSRLYEQLKEADRAKDDFLATLSHELRTPLTPILGWMRILSRFAQSDALIAQGFEVIERNARQQADLINGLLDLTRIISGKIELFREPTSMLSAIQSAIDLIKPQAETRGISLDFKTELKETVCNVDPVRIQQILTNLLSNAIKFTPEGGFVEISLRGPGQHLADGSAVRDGVVIEVTDSGIGIESEVLPRVFDRFFQGQGGLNRKYGGLGLGLAISRALVEMHGGRITVASPGPSLGSTFSVHLPEVLVHSRLPDRRAVGAGPSASEPITQAVIAVPPDQTHAEGTKAASAGQDEKARPLKGNGIPGLRLLIVEDSDDTLDVLTRWLTASGFEVISARKATEGIRLAETARPDLVISDIGMPEMDGYQLVRRLRKMAGLEKVPAIALTGYAGERDRELALKAGYDAHLPKPADLDALLLLINKLTGPDSLRRLAAE